MMTRREAALALATALLLPLPAAYAQAVRTPKPGSAERKALMDALRVPVGKKLKRPVIFKVDALKVQGDWAFLRGVPLQKDGTPVDYRGTEYAQAKKEGVFDDWICALMRRQQGKWRVVTYVIGATDVAYEGWDKQYKAPPAIFQ